MPLLAAETFFAVEYWAQVVFLAAKTFLVRSSALAALLAADVFLARVECFVLVALPAAKTFFARGSWCSALVALLTVETSVAHGP